MGKAEQNPDEYRAYMRSYMKKRRADRMATLRDMFGNQCLFCGSTDSLEFDHIDPSTKQYTIYTAQLLDGPWDRILAEVEKCQLLCSPCHKEKTRVSGDLSNEPPNKILDPQHGTGVMYGRGRCRCGLCKQWKSDNRNGLVDHQGNSLSGGSLRVGEPSC